MSTSTKMSQLPSLVRALGVEHIKHALAIPKTTLEAVKPITTVAPTPKIKVNNPVKGIADSAASRLTTNSATSNLARFAPKLASLDRELFNGIRKGYVMNNIVGNTQPDPFQFSPPPAYHAALGSKPALQMNSILEYLRKEGMYDQHNEAGIKDAINTAFNSLNHVTGDSATSMDVGIVPSGSID